jgi:hypothetical protein
MPPRDTGLSLRRALRRADRNRQARRVVLATHGYEPPREAAMAAHVARRKGIVNRLVQTIVTRT